MNSETDDEHDLLPPDWLTEGVEEAKCLKVGDGRRLSLKAATGARYFGVRLAGSRAVEQFSMGRISFSYSLASHRDVVGLHLVMREWRQAGPFNFQSQKALPLASDSSTADVCLSVREAGMALEPVLLFEAVDPDASAEATIFIDDLQFDVS